MKKLVEKLLSWCKKSMKMRRCVGKSTAPVTGQVGGANRKCGGGVAFNGYGNGG